MKGFFGIFLLVGLISALSLPNSEAAKKVIKDGSKVSFDYTLTVEGKVIDSSEGRKPLEYTQGQGQIVPGLEKELLGLAAGEEKQVKVSPDQGYGQIDLNAFREVPKESLPPELKPQVGMVLAMQGPSGRPLPVKVSDVKENSVVLDLNHPLAGKELNFKVKIVSVE